MPTLRLASSCLMPSTHDDGLGEGWTDCTPTGTDSLAEATLACEAHGSLSSFCATLVTCEADGDGGVALAVCSGAYTEGATYGSCACWTFQGPGAGHVESSPTGCFCATDDDPAWD